jgi:hypothetical protein
MTASPQRLLDYARYLYWACKFASEKPGQELNFDYQGKVPNDYHLLKLLFCPYDNWDTRLWAKELQLFSNDVSVNKNSYQIEEMDSIIEAASTNPGVSNIPFNLPWFDPCPNIEVNEPHFDKPREVPATVDYNFKRLVAWRSACYLREMAVQVNLDSEHLHYIFESPEDTQKRLITDYKALDYFVNTLRAHEKVTSGVHVTPALYHHSPTFPLIKADLEPLSGGQPLPTYSPDVSSLLESLTFRLDKKVIDHAFYHTGDITELTQEQQKQGWINNELGYSVYDTFVNPNCMELTPENFKPRVKTVTIMEPGPLPDL